MRHKIGDRLYDTFDHSNFEVVDYEDQRYQCICLDPGTTTLSKGEIVLLYLIDPRWRYLGNFAKQSNFETLYNLMNE